MEEGARQRRDSEEPRAMQSTAMRALAVVLFLASAVLAFVCIVFAGSPSLLLQKTPPVYYIPSSMVGAMGGAAQQGPSMTAAVQHRTAAKTQTLAKFLHYGGGGQKAAIVDPTENDDALAKFMQYNMRSCAVSSLVDQAKEVFPYWDRCGYLLSEGPGLSLIVGSNGQGVISAPTNDVDCKPSNIDKKPCREEMVRTLARNDAESLSECMKKVYGLSQTCDFYDDCGPPQWISRTSVCSAPDGGFYKEPEVERMCGICAMFRSTTGPWAKTPENALQEKADSGGCFAAASEVEVEGRGRVELRSVRAGDRVKTHRGQFEGVYYVHEHKQPARTVELALGGDAEGKTRTLRLTPTHYLPVWGRGMAAAGSVVAGDRVWVGEAGEAVEVAAVSSGKAEAVVWVLVEGEELLVNGIRASVWSSPAQAAETLPFRALAALAPTLLQWEPVAAAISAVLESPLRKAAAAATVALLFPRPRAAAHDARWAVGSEAVSQLA